MVLLNDDKIKAPEVFKKIYITMAIGDTTLYTDKANDEKSDG